MSIMTLRISETMESAPWSASSRLSAPSIRRFIKSGWGRILRRDGSRLQYPAYCTDYVTVSLYISGHFHPNSRTPDLFFTCYGVTLSIKRSSWQLYSDIEWMHVEENGRLHSVSIVDPVQIIASMNASIWRVYMASKFTFHSRFSNASYSEEWITCLFSKSYTRLIASHACGITIVCRCLHTRA